MEPAVKTDSVFSLPTTPDVNRQTINNLCYVKKDFLHQSALLPCRAYR